MIKTSLFTVANRNFTKENGHNFKELRFKLNTIELFIWKGTTKTIKSNCNFRANQKLKYINEAY